MIDVLIFRIILAMALAFAVGFGCGWMCLKEKIGYEKYRGQDEV